MKHTIKFVCVQCNKEFSVYPSVAAKGAKYCSRPCQQEARRGMKLGNRVARERLTCGHCGNQFEYLPCQMNHGRGLYCSQNCYWIAKNGKPLTERHERIENGYVYLDGGCEPRQAKHRVIMEEKLGRKLDRNEHVHHENEIRSDNTEDNLKVLTASDHRKHHAAKQPRHPITKAFSSS